MGKTSQKVTKDKDPKRVDGGCKSRENLMKKMKDNILKDAKKGGGDTNDSSNETTRPTNNSSNEATRPTNNSSNETTSVTNNITAIGSNDTYVYGVGILAVFAIDVCVFFGYNTFSKNKKNVNEKQDQPPKRHHTI